MQQALPSALPERYQSHGCPHQAGRDVIQIGEGGLLFWHAETLGDESKRHRMVSGCGFLMHLLVELRSQWRWLQGHGGAQEGLTRVPAFEAELAWHLVCRHR